MSDSFVLQGRLLGPAEIGVIRALISENPDWHRNRISQELCQKWEWRDSIGRLKDMACRTMLLKLDARGLIELPPPRHRGNHKRKILLQPVLHDTSPILGPLRSLGPIRLLNADSGDRHAMWQTLMQGYHYLGFATRVGKNICYLAVDARERPLAALLFGAAAWKTAPRDRFIGWSPQARAKNLEWVVNNMRFLIPPWVQVKLLASHVLGLSLRQLAGDWSAKYGFSPLLAETFVERGRFRGTCYKAANWQYAGSTTGRTRQDRHHCINTPVKDIYLYPLCPDFKTRLSR